MTPEFDLVSANKLYNFEAFRTISKGKEGKVDIHTSTVLSPHIKKYKSSVKNVFEEDKI